MMVIPGAMLLLTLIAFGLTLIHGVNGKIPIWIPVLLLCIIHLLMSAAR